MIGIPFALGIHIGAGTVTPGVVPTYSGLSFSSGGGGDPDQISVADYAYGGADTVNLYGVYANTGTTLAAGDIIAGSGTGILAAFNDTGIDGSTALDLTSGNEAATHVQIVFAEANNGGQSAVGVVAVSNLDFTAPTFSSAATTSATVIVVETSESLLGTPVLANTTVKVGGVSVTVSAVSIVSGALSITLDAAVSSGNVLLVSYDNSGGELEDAKSNALTSFTDQSVTNNVGSGSGIYVGYKAFGVQSSTRTFDISTLDAIGSASGTGDGGTIAENDIVLVFYGHTNSSSQTHAISTTGFSTLITADYFNGNPGVKVGLYGKVMGATPDTSIEVSSFGTNDATIEIFFVVLRGVDFATIAGSLVSGLTPPAQTPTEAGSVIFAAAWRGSDQTLDTVAVGANMTSIAAVNTDGNNRDGAGALGYHEWSSGTFTPDAFTSTGGAASAALSIIVEPA